jgi:hypothetical protein
MMFSSHEPSKRRPLWALPVIFGAALACLGPEPVPAADPLSGSPPNPATTASGGARVHEMAAAPAAISPAGSDPMQGMTAPAARETAVEHAMKHHDPAYLCPMHPQVVSNEPGRCPICGMDLVAKNTAPAASDSEAMAATAVPTVTVSDVVMNQLGVRTAAVRRGSLTRRIEGFGVFVRSTSSTNLLVLGQVFEREAPLIRQGQTVRVRFPNLGAREWKGTVTSLETQISLTTHTLQFRVSVDSEGAYVPGGMTAIVTVEVDPIPDVLLVPREAVIVTGTGARVMLALGGGRFQQRAVDAEDIGEPEIVIRSGLHEGEQVVVSAQFLLDSEANLQAGLMRLTGGETRSGSGHAEGVAAGTVPAAEMSGPTTHDGTMQKAATHEGTMQ